MDHSRQIRGGLPSPSSCQFLPDSPKTQNQIEPKPPDLSKLHHHEDTSPTIQLPGGRGRHSPTLKHTISQAIFSVLVHVQGKGALSTILEVLCPLSAGSSSPAFCGNHPPPEMPSPCQEEHHLFQHKVSVKQR